MDTLLIAEDDIPMRLVSLALGEPPDARMQQGLERLFGPDPQAGLARLTALGRELGLAGKLRTALASDAPLAAQAADADILLLEKTPADAEVIERARRLRLIQVFGTDCSSVDRAAAARRGIPVLPLRRWVNTSVAEHTLMLLLAVLRRTLGAHAAASAPPKMRVKPGASYYNWGLLPGVQGLSGKSLGILGLGEIGREVAQLAAAFGMRVSYTQRHRAAAEEEQACRARYASLQDLLRESDAVSVHLPLTEATRHFIGAGELRAMKPGAVLVNTSRGALVDEAALVAALRAGRLGGAGLDVREEEPPPAAGGFAGLDNVVLSPHVAAGSGEPLLLDTRAVLEHAAEALARAT